MSDETVYVYLIAVQDDGRTGPVKVGIANNVRKRQKSLQTACPYKLGLVHAFAFPNREMAREVEQCFHDGLSDKREIGEWFRLNPIIALNLLIRCIETMMEIRAPGTKGALLEQVYGMNGMDAAREKLAGWMAQVEKFSGEHRSH